MDRLSAVGLGHGRQRSGAGLPEKVRFGDGAERPHSPDHAKGRRKCDLSYRGLHGVSATGSGQSGFSGADEGPGGATEKRSGHHRCELRARTAGSRGRRFFAGVKSQSNTNSSSNDQKKEKEKNHEEKCVCCSSVGNAGFWNRRAGRRNDPFRVRRATTKGPDAGSKN